MAIQFRDPGSPSRSSGGKPGLLLDGYVIVDQSNRSEASRSIRCKSTMATLAVTPVPPASQSRRACKPMARPPRAGAIAHAQKMRRLFPDTGAGAQETPLVIPQLETDRDPGGVIATFQPNGPAITS